MAALSSFLAWRIPWTEEPSGLQSMGSHRVGHNWVTWQQTVNDVESLFTGLLAISMSCLGKCPLQSSAHFLTGLFCSWMLWVLCVFWICTLLYGICTYIVYVHTYIVYMYCEYLLSLRGLHFHSLKVDFWVTLSWLNLNASTFPVYFKFISLCFLFKCPLPIEDFQVALVVKDLPANAGNLSDAGSVLG